MPTSQHSSTLSLPVDRAQLERLSTSIRGKLQFMDYLVRAAVADVDRFTSETDAGTRNFLRQLVEMHASNLAIETENMRLVEELCAAIESSLSGADDEEAGRDSREFAPENNGL